MNKWYTVTVDLDFAQNQVAFGVNGREVVQMLTEGEGGVNVDPSLFKSSLTQKTFRVGVHQSPEGEEPEWRNDYEISVGNTTTSNVAEVLVDNLIIQSPTPDGNAELVKSSLTAFTQHVSGSQTLSQQELETQLTTLRDNLNEVNPADFVNEIKSFTNAHASKFGAIYRIINRNNTDNTVYDNLPAESQAYIDLGVWLLGEGISSQNASDLQGIIYIEHTEFPGELAVSAERVTSDKANVRVQYVRDKGYLMGGMRQEPESELAAYLYRPTGFYAPAGEVVKVTVPEALVNSGVHIRVGAHADNHIGLASTSRFPLISSDFRVENTSTEVINPFGGNIYILVPQDIDLGWNEIIVENAVRAPFFSTREGYETPAEQWSTMRQFPGLFADFESDKFMITVPTAQLQSFDQPQELLEVWDQIMDIMQTLHGRPLERSRAEAYLLDASQLVVGSFPGGYPVTPGLYAEGDSGITDGYYTPFAALNDKSWEEDQGMFVMLHELGHHHNGRFILEGEQESYVNVPAIAVLNQVYGLSIDEALRFSAYQFFNLTETAIDWMVTYNFRNGNPIGFDPTTDIEPIETSYQNRGHAKYADLALISGGWDAVGKIYQTYYLDDLESENPPNTQIGVSHDDFLIRGSQALECNLGSLFNFWGIQPSDSAFTEINEYPVCDGALERVLHYLDNAPRTIEELREFHTEKTAVHENQLKYQVWDQLLVDFDIEMAQQIKDAGAVLLTKYFNIEKDNAPSQPTPLTTNVELESDASNSVEFSWQNSSDDSNRELKYSWVLKDPNNDEVLLSKTWLIENSVEISANEMSSALGNYLEQTEGFELVQVVTTSDTFSVVSSEPVTTNFTFQSSDDSGGGDDSGGDSDSGDSDGSGGSSSGNTNPVSSTGSESGSGGGGSIGISVLTLLMALLFIRRKYL